jgi:CubicO group peptidase (beta-lactamase class C family)
MRVFPSVLGRCGLTGLVLLGLAACATAPAAAPAIADFSALEASASGDGFSAEGLAALESRMAEYVETGRLKGISTLLVKDGAIIHYADHGIARDEGALPVAEDTIFRIYSMSKPVTGAALMTLYDDGHFSLDDPVSKFVPEFANLRVYKGLDEAGAMILEDARHIPTMREILSHTGGFAYGLFGDDPVNQAYRDQRVLGSPDLDTYIERLATLPLLHQPGTSWYYSTSVDIQGYIVQKISGKPLSQYMREELFEPLGMADTGFHVPAEKYHRFADVYRLDPESGGLARIEEPSFAFRKETIGMEAGGHGLVSTIGDYARFCEMMVNGGSLGNVQILKPETVELMRTNVLAEGMGLFQERPEEFRRAMAGQGFGLGVAVVNEPSANGYAAPAGSYYWGGAAGTWFWIDPANNLFFIGMIQIFGTNGADWEMRRESSRLVYAAMQE